HLPQGEIVVVRAVDAQNADAPAPADGAEAQLDGLDAASLQPEHVEDLLPDRAVDLEAHGVDAYVGSTTTGETANALDGILLGNVERVGAGDFACLGEAIIL